MLEYFKVYAFGLAKFILPWGVIAAFLYIQPFGDWFRDPAMEQAAVSWNAFEAKISSYSPEHIGEIVGKTYAYADDRVCKFKVNGEVFSNVLSAAHLPASAIREGGSLWNDVKSGAQAVILLASNGSAETLADICRSALWDYGQHGVLIPGLLESGAIP